MLFTAVGGQTRSALRLSRAFHGCGLASPFVWYHSIATTFQAAVPPPTISTSTVTTTTITTYMHAVQLRGGGDAPLAPRECARADAVRNVWSCVRRVGVNGRTDMNGRTDVNGAGGVI